MSVLVSLARAHAVLAGRAQPIATVRHVHLATRPLLLVPLGMAGEANAPVAAMVGADRDTPQLLIVPQPRDRDQRFGFAAELATTVLAYIDTFRGATEQVPGDRARGGRLRHIDAPQVIVPNRAAIGFLRLLGRSTRFRRTSGGYAVPASVPELGRWLTFLAERSEHPGSCLLLAATEALAAHWASGQSAVEDLNLATLLGWIDPPDGLTGLAAARQAEDPVAWPPAGPVTDPGFDNEVLARLITAYHRSADEPALRRRARASLESALAGQLEPTWRLLWQAVDLLGRMSPGERVVERWAADRAAFSRHVEHLDGGGPPQPRRDNAVAAASRLNWLEREHADYLAQRALDDPLVLAELRLSGEAFAGTVVTVDPTRLDGSGGRRKLRPHLTVATDDPVRVEPGTTLVAPTRPGQKALVLSIVNRSPAASAVNLELSGGMGSSLVARTGSVPEVGERICYTAPAGSFQPPTAFPSVEETPWTHGGPPPPYVPLEDDAREEWS